MLSTHSRLVRTASALPAACLVVHTNTTSRVSANMIRLVGCSLGGCFAEEVCALKGLSGKECRAMYLCDSTPRDSILHQQISSPRCSNNITQLVIPKIAKNKLNRNEQLQPYAMHPTDTSNTGAKFPFTLSMARTSPRFARPVFCSLSLSL